MEDFAQTTICIEQSIEGDYSQLEFRLSASFAKEPRLLSLFAVGSDVDVFNDMRDALGMERHECKTLTYTIMYGGGINRIKNVFGVSESEAEAIRANFFSVYPNLLKASRFASNYAKAHKQVPIWSGRNRHFLNVKEEAHKAYNSLTQGGAADIVERTMLRSDAEGFNTDDCKMLLQVHDSIVWEIREDLVESYIPELKRMMSNVTGVAEDVFFKADIHEWGVAG
jgi:DNA polymerase-1